MSKPIDITGQRFGRLVAIRDVGTRKLRRIWLCKCDCGNTGTFDSHRLRRGNTTSCGCYQLESMSRNGKLKTTHGMSREGLGVTWRAMIYRCYSPKAIAYQTYGGRGICVCEFLRASPANLKLLIGDRPRKQSIDRKNPDGHYSCGACSECLRNDWPMNIRWATAIEQGRNKRNNRIVTIDGITRCATEWNKDAGLSQSLIYQRLARGESGKQLIAAPHMGIPSNTIPA